MNGPDAWGAPALARHLRTDVLGRAAEFVTTCGSTNDLVAQGSGTHDEGWLVVADTQSGGRGRQGRVWHSPPGSSLYFSLLLRPALPIWNVPPLSLLAGAGLAEALLAVGATPQLKWPNDVLLPTPAGARKVAGILTEMASERERIRHVVLGVGLNVNGREFPPDLTDRATSLALALARPFDRTQLLAGFLNAFEPMYRRFVAQGPEVAVAAWRQFARLGARCRVEREGHTLEGVAIDVDPSGALRVRDDAGREHVVLSGEVAVWKWPEDHHRV